MRALVYQVNPLGHITCKWLRHLWRGCLTTPLNGLSLKKVDQPRLPRDDWVLVRTLLGGICGSDTAILAQKQPIDSILQAYSSQPMMLGHENVGIVAEVGQAVSDDWIHKRVCVEPTLNCVVRGVEPQCRRCRAGEFSACESFGDEAQGAARIPPATSIGYNHRTGGAFAEALVAHESQLVPVPDGLTDRQAVLTDPLACSLHAVLRSDMASAERTLVYGAGMIGLGVIGAAGHGLCRRNRRGRPQRAPRRARPALGRGQVPPPPAWRVARSAVIAERTGATLKVSRFANPMLSGGYDLVFDCVGSSSALTECLKWTRARGQAVMVATGAGRGVDMTPIWFRELTVIGAYGRQIERLGGRAVGTYQLAHELMVAGKLDTEGMLTHTFALEKYRKAFDVAMHKSAHRAIKVALDFR